MSTELSKLDNKVEELNDDDNEETRQKKQLEFIFHYGSYVLWKYLKQKFEIDLTEVYPKIPIDEPFITKDNVKLTMRIVDKNHINDLNKKFIPDINFFVNAVNTVYNTLKIGLEHKGENILEKYEFKIDEDYKLYLDENDTYRLAVVSME